MIGTILLNPLLTEVALLMIIGIYLSRTHLTSRQTTRSPQIFNRKLAVAMCKFMAIWLVGITLMSRDPSNNKG